MTWSKRMRPMMGTFVEVGFDSAAVSDVAWVFQCTFQALEEVVSLMSFHDVNSDLSRINAQPGQWVRVQAPTVALLQRAKQLMLDSDHLFNCTVGGYLVRDGILPEHEGYASALPAGRAEDLDIDGDAVRLRRPVLVTLDGIAKGFAVDRAVNAMWACGVETGWVNAGGDLRCFGAVTLPVALRTADGYQRLTLQNAALACSNTSHSEDFPSKIFHSDGGSPDDIAISVQADSAWLADGVTKVLVLAEPEARSALAKKLGARHLSL
jgi:Membrane-associated lipoprotein involved in thiamine biosynthesis